MYMSGARHLQGLATGLNEGHEHLRFERIRVLTAEHLLAHCERLAEHLQRRRQVALRVEDDTWRSATQAYSIHACICAS